VPCSTRHHRHHELLPPAPRQVLWCFPLACCAARAASPSSCLALLIRRASGGSTLALHQRHYRRAPFLFVSRATTHTAAPRLPGGKSETRDGVIAAVAHTLLRMLRAGKQRPAHHTAPTILYVSSFLRVSFTPHINVCGTYHYAPPQAKTAIATSHAALSLPLTRS